MNKRSYKHFDQRGMSLVEVMIGLLLSMVLSAGVIQIYLSNKQTYYLQDEMSRLQENGRFAIEVLQRTIRGAGDGGGQVFGEVNTVDASDPPVPYNPANAAIQTSSNDQIEVVRMGWTDCTGTPVSVPPADPVPISEFFYIDQNKNLACFSGAAVARLVENVETMEITYGVDEDGDRNADRYTDATRVEIANAWTRIVSVRIGLVLSTSPDESRSRMVPQRMTFPTVAAHPLLVAFQTNNAGQPALFDSGDADLLPDTNNAPDNRLYRVFTTTLALRNRIP
ncbi:MAG: PilW family protein [Methylococcaceae bacterium]|nr:PilW family protein [Methylococcaceae bacterium]